MVSAEDGGELGQQRTEARPQPDGISYEVLGVTPSLTGGGAGSFGQMTFESALEILVLADGRRGPAGGGMAAHQLHVRLLIGRVELGQLPPLAGDA
jgi:hypothetical protein